MWYEMKKRFNLTADEDGMLVRANFFIALNNMLRRDVDQMPPLSSFTKEWPMRLCFQFDGTGLWGYSLCHAALKNGSYDHRTSQHSERLLETLFVAHGGDGHAGMLENLGDCPPPHGATPDPECLAVQASKLIEAGQYTFNGVTFPLELLVAADLKGVESFRGCGHCSPWCCCDDDQKHLVPFGGDLQKIDACDYAAAAAEAKRICKYPVSNKMAAAMGHTVITDQALPPPCPSRLCESHGKPPFPSLGAWKASDVAWAKIAKDAKALPQKAAAAKTRTAYCHLHLRQKRGDKFLLPLESMAYVPVELLHFLYLNTPKMLFKWLIKRHLSFKSRQKAMEYFSAYGCAVDLKTKAEGRRTEDKWFSGAAWQKVVEGTDRNPFLKPTLY